MPGFQNVRDSLDDVATELELDRDIGVLVSLIYARAHRELDDIAVEQHTGQAHGGIGSHLFGSEALFNEPVALAFDPAGDMYVVDRQNQTIRMITSNAVVSTLAGSVTNAGAQDGERGTGRQLRDTNFVERRARQRHLFF